MQGHPSLRFHFVYTSLEMLLRYIRHLEDVSDGALRLTLTATGVSSDVV